jgi:hypothetical protein
MEEAVALNRALSRVRVRLARVRRLLVGAAAPIRIRRRPPKDRTI